MARASDLSWLSLDDNSEWNYIFTMDKPFNNKYYNITFTAISILYKILKAIYTLLVPIAILLGRWLASLTVLILFAVRLSILVLIPKIFGDGFEGHQEVLRPFFSVMWNIWGCIDFHYPDLPDGNKTHIQPSDTRAEQWMRQLVQEDRIKRQARQNEQDRIAEAENRRKNIENERIGLVWTGLQSRGPPAHQRLRERSGLSLVAAPRPRKVTLAGSFRASDPVSPPLAREPAPIPSHAPDPPTPSPLPAPALADARHIPSGREIKRAWEEGRYNSLWPRRTVVKDRSTQTELIDLASHGIMTEPIELLPQPRVSRGVLTHLVDLPAQKEPEVPVVVPELPVSERSPDPASPEDTQRSLDKGKALDGPKPTIDTNLVIIHEDKAEDEVKEPEYSAALSPLPAFISLPDSHKPTTDARPELMQCITSGAQDNQSEASLQTFTHPFSSVVPTENEYFTASQSATVYPYTERNRQAMTAACENVSKETSLLNIDEDEANLPSASTPFLPNTPNHYVSEKASIGKLFSSHGTSSIPPLEEIEDMEVSLDQMITTSAYHGDGGFEPGATGDPGVSTEEEQAPLASTTDDAQMVDVWRPNEEESKKIEDAAQDLFKELMDQDDEDSSEDTIPEREPSMSPRREIVAECQQANLKATPMQDVQSSAPPAITAGLQLPIQQPEDPSVQVQPFISPESRPEGQGVSPREEDAKLAEMLVASFEEDDPDTPSQDAQPLPSADPLLEAFRARVKAAETEPQTDKYYPQVPKDLDSPDPVKEATAEQRANRKIAKPMSRAHKYTPAAQPTLQSVSQGQPYLQSEKLQQTPSQANEDRGVDIAEMDSAACSLLELAAATGIIVGNDASNQAASPADQESIHKDTNAQETDVQNTSSQKTNTHVTNMQESSISDPEVERPKATTLPEEQPAPNSQQPQKASTSILLAQSQHSLVQSTPTETLPAQPSPAVSSTAAAQQHTPTTNNSPPIAGPSNTQQPPSICPVMHGRLLLPGGNPTLFNTTATGTSALKKSGPDPEKVAELHKKKQAQLKKQRSKKTVCVFMQPKRPAAVPPASNTPQMNPTSSTQGRSPSLTAIDESDVNVKADLDSTFGAPGSNTKKQGLQIIDIKDIPDHQRIRIQRHDAGRESDEEE
ncbi:hypothetical protein FGADI_7143 [Fusarium gaditjirri]|uniref:Uncharacterized protein n=1 Tax=Fusarium gaditjirri TaxID=282569 RepID=A0A8H4T5Z6_9HYPO|nr:hypothetical protein FGADI_7143 [Fusarium gaditjirri]